MDNPQERLEALGGMAAEVDAANPSAEQVEQQDREEREAVAVDEAAKAWGMIPYSIGQTLAMLAPELRQVYTEEACYEWGKGAAAVSKKYGWDSPASMPELVLATATLNFAVPSYFVVREKLREMREGRASGLLAKVGVWWRARKAAKAAKAAEPGDASGAVVPAEAGAKA